MLSLIQNTPTWNRANSGGALYSCWDHCIAFASIGWNGIQIGQNGPTIQQALGDWYFERTPTTPKLIDCLDPIVPDQPTVCVSLQPCFILTQFSVILLVQKTEVYGKSLKANRFYQITLISSQRNIKTVVITLQLSKEHTQSLTSE